MVCNFFRKKSLDWGGGVFYSHSFAVAALIWTYAQFEPCRFEGGGLHTLRGRGGVPLASERPPTDANRISARGSSHVKPRHVHSGKGWGDEPGGWGGIGLRVVAHPREKNNTNKSDGRSVTWGENGVWFRGGGESVYRRFCPCLRPDVLERGGSASQIFAELVSLSFLLRNHPLILREKSCIFCGVSLGWHQTPKIIWGFNYSQP